MTGSIRSQVADYYTDRLRRFGPTPAGVDWNSEAGQRARFDALLPDLDRSESILDVGCGYGALLDHLRDQMPEWSGRYLGVDLSAEMVAAARERTGFPERFSDDLPDDRSWDRVVGSGLFNVKGEVEPTAWWEFVRTSLAEMFQRCRGTMSFNLLTAYSDPDRMRSDLFYARPGDLLDHCATTMSRSLVLDHDYGLFEFTVHVRRMG